MKKLLLLLVSGLFVISSYAQECSTMWPYIYPEFKDATIYTKGGTKFDRKINIHVQGSTVHYIDDHGIIRETKSEDLLLVDTGNDKFMYVDGRVMKVVGTEEHGFIATLILGDFAKLNSTAGAYGSSSSSSAVTKLTSVEAGIIGQNHMQLKQNRDYGKLIELRTSYFIVVDGDVYPASKKAIESKLSEDKKTEFKAFLKKNKIKWNKVESLQNVLKFFNQ